MPAAFSSAAAAPDPFAVVFGGSRGHTDSAQRHVLFMPLAHLITADGTVAACELGLDDCCLGEYDTEHVLDTAFAEATQQFFDSFVVPSLETTFHELNTMNRPARSDDSAVVSMPLMLAVTAYGPRITEIAFDPNASFVTDDDEFLDPLDIRTAERYFHKQVAPALRTAMNNLTDFLAARPMLLSASALRQ